MAYKTNGPFGFQPRYKIGGQPWTGGLVELPILDGYATSLFTGDPLIGSGSNDGTVARATAGSGVVRGVFFGCKYTNSSGELIHGAYWPASTTVLTGTTPYALVIEDPDVVWTVQEDNGSGAAGTALALAARGLNISFAFPAAGSTVTGMSGATIKNDTENTTATLACKILDLDRGHPDNQTVGSFANWLVIFNNHALKGGTGTTGTGTAA